MGLTNGGYKLEWKLWNRGNNVWCHIFYQPNGFEVYLNHPNTFLNFLCNFQMHLLNGTKAKNKRIGQLGKRVRKDEGSWCCLKHKFGFLFFLRIKVFFILIYWILTTLKIKRTQYMWKKNFNYPKKIIIIITKIMQMLASDCKLEKVPHPLSQ